MLIIPIIPKKKTIENLLVGNKTRESSLTDVGFISDSLIVCCDRQTKILYLLIINFETNSSKIIHQVDLQFKPDLFDVSNNTIYIANLNEIISVYKIVDNKTLNFIRNYSFGSNYQYHGIYVKGELLFLAGTFSQKIITVYNLTRIGHTDYTIPRLENKNLKDIVFIDKDRILIIASDGVPIGSNKKENPYKSYIYLYIFNGHNFNFLDGITYENCHVDSVIFTEGKYFVTSQLNDTGYILNGYIENNFLIPQSHINVPDFPHGLAVSKCKKYIAYTCYSTSSLYIGKNTEFDVSLI
jgi:hypothetical protein